MDIPGKASVLLVYFSDEAAANQILMFKGTAKEIREKRLGEDWDGFNLADSLNLNGENVRVYVKSENLVGTDMKYYVGPKSLNPVKVDYTKLNFSEFVD